MTGRQCNSPIAHLNDCIQRMCDQTNLKPGPTAVTAQPESVSSDPTTTSLLASAMEDSSYEDSRSRLNPTTIYKSRRSTRMSKLPERFKPYAKPEDINSVLATIRPRDSEYKDHRDGDPTPNFGEQSATLSTQSRLGAEAMESKCIPSATNVSEDAAQFLLGELLTNLSEKEMLGATEVECILRPSAVFDDGICRNNFVSHDGGTSDKNPGMDSELSAPRETSISPMSLVTMGKDATMSLEILNLKTLRTTCTSQPRSQRRMVYSLGWADSRGKATNQVLEGTRPRWGPGRPPDRRVCVFVCVWEV